MSVEPVRGVGAAAHTYGEPVEVVARLDLTLQGLHYWEQVTHKRTAEVVLALRRPDGRIVVHTKAFYPDGVYRLLTGGCKSGEDLVEAALREGWEETGTHLTIERFVAVIHNRFQHGLDTIRFDSYLFLLSDEGQELHSNDPDEAITDYQFVTPTELIAVADQLDALAPEWADWGHFRAVSHRLLAQELA